MNIPNRSFCNKKHVFNRREKLQEHENSKTHSKSKNKYRKIKNLRKKVQFTLSTHVTKEYTTKIASFSPFYLEISFEVETFKQEKRFNETDINPLVKQILTIYRHSTLVEQFITNF